jgi:hypothetical protein
MKIFYSSLLVFFCLMSLVACDEFMDLGGGMPYALSTTKAANIIPRKNFHFSMGLYALKVDLVDAQMEIKLPKEVELVKGDLLWKGQIKRKNDQWLDLHMKSLVEMDKWSSEIKGRVVFTTSEGEKVWREVKWSARGFEDSDWKEGK